MIATQNHGPLILSSSYWGSEEERAGKIFCSTNAGAVRLLVPASKRELIEAARGSRYAILSRGPWPAAGLAEAVEILFEDHTDTPYVIQLSPESFDLVPAEPPTGREWVIALWDLKKGKPHKAVERPCHWRRVPQLPWMKPWEE